VVGAYVAGTFGYGQSLGSGEKFGRRWTDCSSSGARAWMRVCAVYAAGNAATRSLKPS
jgi:hypothetical protein